ncbi:histidine phosphatase family protein [Thermodesulfovibrio yellowstonii]|uniref:histidine phosphatase family protein n=1 Tax=Thermodesulfovibrio yellowstonii TaxID=28262 RepID=UPI0024B393E4|nr:histidine phosphatase family protein [Thermodesulfovibrio yellowstonii]MDI6864589.1 histidine phosphatase family protein [Thermodesulfovibrio yellowstonii]
MNPTLVIYLLRHGETEGPKKVYKGHIDVPLSKIGEKQVEKVAQFLKNYIKKYELQPKIIYSSPLKRAVTSAEILSKALLVEVKSKNILKERNFGTWEGLSINDIVSLYPEEFERWRRDPLRFCPPQGESTIQVSKRASDALKEILKNHNGSQIFITAHGGINRVILCNILGMPLENIFRIEQEFACVNIIEFYESQPVVKLINGVFWRDEYF